MTWSALRCRGGLAQDGGGHRPSHRGLRSLLCPSHSTVSLRRKHRAGGLWRCAGSKTQPSRVSVCRLTQCPPSSIDFDHSHGLCDLPSGWRVGLGPSGDSPIARLSQSCPPGPRRRDQPAVPRAISRCVWAPLSCHSYQSGPPRRVCEYVCMSVWVQSVYLCPDGGTCVLRVWREEGSGLPCLLRYWQPPQLGLVL